MEVGIDRDSHVPLYEQVKKYIREKIRCGEFSPGKLVPSEVELADELDVSRITTKRALNDLASEGLIFRIPGKGSFVSENVLDCDRGVGLLEHKGAIGFIMPFKDEFWSEVLAGAERIITSRGYDLILRNAQNISEFESEQAWQLYNTGASGVILFPAYPEKNRELFVRFKELDYPFVIIDRYLPGMEVDYVGIDNFGASYELTKHLYQNGHRRIAYLTIPYEGITSIQDRIAGYRRALDDLGSGDANGVVGVVDSVEDHEGIKRFLQEEAVDAVLGVNDYLAVAIFSMARKMGMLVPKDIAIVGFDDLLVASHLSVPLTTVRQPWFTMGETAARMVLDKIRFAYTNCRKVVLPVDLVIRKSCGSGTMAKYA